MTLLEYRKQAGFGSQEDLAKVLEISDRSTVSKWESGESYPRAPMIVKLAEVLNVTEGEIIAAITKAREETA